MASARQRGRAAFGRRAWREAYAALGSATSLDVDDHERLAISAYLVGDDEQSVRSWEDAHRAALDVGDSARAAHCGFWLALCLMLRGQMAPASGWLARTERVIEAAGVDCAASGFLLIPRLLHALDAGEVGAAGDLAARAIDYADQFGDADLRAFAVLGHGQALIAAGDVAGGTARLDEVMVAVIASEVGPITAGIVYCAVILECVQLFDLQRAAEWTVALTAWCDEQPDLVPYRGQCLVHRSQVEQAVGRWPDAVTLVTTACERLADPPHPALGLAHYQKAELHRLAGDLAAAETEYRAASRLGHEPLPGFALLQLERGDPEAAAASIRRALQETMNVGARVALLSAAVEILRANGDLAGARSAADDLSEIAVTSSSSALRAAAAHARGAALFAEGDTAAAVVEVRAALSAWRSMRMPFEAARTGVLLALVYAALGDRAAAALEAENAATTFAELGATPDLGRVQSLITGLLGTVERSPDVPVGGRLSARERQVLLHIANGETNRQIAAALHISQHTVGRHVENIFAKLGVTSRAAATALAYEHELL